MKTTKPRRWEELLAEHGDYSITNCRTKIPAIFRWLFGIFRGISKYVFIYFTLCRGTPLLGNIVLIKHRHHQYIRLTGRKPWINVNGLARRLSSMAQRRWRYRLSLGIRAGRWTCRYWGPTLIPVQIVISSKSIRIPSEVSIVLTLVPPWNSVKYFGKVASMNPTPSSN